MGLFGGGIERRFGSAYKSEAGRMLRLMTGGDYKIVIRDLPIIHARAMEQALAEVDPRGRLRSDPSKRPVLTKLEQEHLDELARSLGFSQAK